MDYSSALAQARAGKKIARAGWNGKGMWVFLVTAWTAIVDGQLVTGERVQPFLAMKTVDGTIVPWLCSQSDSLATDWTILEEKTEVRVG